MHRVSEITIRKPDTNINYRTGELHQTADYVYNTADCIGKDSFGFVYLGRQKVTGDKVAAKVIHSDLLHHRDLFIRQGKGALSTLNHENVVKFFVCETEEGSGLPVHILEYCEDGSLQTQLEKPENMFGLSEDVFLVLLQDLTSALNYMWQNKIIHCDIKAANILQDKRCDGRAVYKLTCIGSTRKLTDDGTLDDISISMSSLAVLGENTSQTFDAATNLRSIGITIYHAAVGKLPFRPFHGKADTATLNRIMSKKPKGAISGVQPEESGEIVYSKKFPHTCQLPETLQESLIDVIVGLLDHVLNFEQFFDKASSIQDKIRIRIFHGCMGRETVIYMDSKSRYASLQEEVARLLEIPASNQLLLVLDKELTEMVNVTDEIRTYPKVVIKGIVFFYQPQLVDTHSLGVLNLQMNIKLKKQDGVQVIPMPVENTR